MVTKRMPLTDPEPLTYQVTPDSLEGEAGREEFERSAALADEESRRRWLKISDELKRSMVSGRINRATASIIRAGILGALESKPPLAWSSARKASYECFPLPLEMEALRYVAAARAGFIDDLDPVGTIISEFEIDERTYKRWRQRYRASAWSYFSVGETLSRNVVYWQTIAQIMKSCAEKYRRRRPNKGEDETS